MLRNPIQQEFLMEVDVAFGIHSWLGLVGFQFYGAVDVVIMEGFAEVPTIAENTEGGIPAVNVPVLGVPTREPYSQITHGGAQWIRQQPLVSHYPRCLPQSPTRTASHAYIVQKQ